VADVPWGVSVTPDNGSAGWTANTTNHTATFTVTNTGDCNDSYSFTAGTSGPVTNVRLDKTSAPVFAHASTPVTATYDVGAAGSGQLTLTAGSANSGDGGAFTVTATSYGVTVTPDGQVDTVAAGTAQSVVFQVKNTGSAANTYTLACSTTGSETCGTVTPSQVTGLASGNTASVTVNFTAGAAGTSGTVVLQASGGGGATDNGNYAVANVKLGVTVTPDGKPRSANANAIQSLTFQVRDTGTVNATYTLSCVAAGSETCGTVSLAQLTNAAPGITNVVTVTFTAGAPGTSGTITLHAAGMGGVSDDGTFSLTNVAAPVVVTPDAQGRSVGANSSQSLTFSLQNGGSSTEKYTLSCVATGNETCGSVSPSQVTVGPGQAGPVTVNFTAGATGTGTVILHALGSRGGSDDGTYTVTNTPPPPSYGVTITPDAGPVRVRSGSPQSATFVLTNTGSVTDTFGLVCSAAGGELCRGEDYNGQQVALPSVIAPPGSPRSILVNFLSQSSGSGTITLHATGHAGGTGGAVDDGSYNVTNWVPPAENCTAMLSVPAANYGAEPDVLQPDGARPATVCPPVSVSGVSGGGSWLGDGSPHVALFAITDTTGAPSGPYDLSCSGTPPVSCAVINVGTVSLSGGSTIIVGVTFSVSGGGNGLLTVTATSQNNPAVHPSGSMGMSGIVPTYGVAVTPDVQAGSADIQSAQTAAFHVQSTGTGTETYSLTCTTTGNETCGTVNPATVTGSAAVSVTFNAGAVGSGTVVLHATGNHGSIGTGTYTVKNTYFVAVTPDGVAEARLAARTYADTFAVRNVGINPATFNFSATCSGAAIASGCTASVASLTLADGDSGKVGVSYTTGAAGASGQVKLMATATADATAKDSGSTTVTVGTAQVPTVDVASLNPGPTRERGLCLTFAAGDEAATECGDLRIVHPLPATRTLNKLRIPTLLYNSAEAGPYPLVAASVTLPAGAATPDTVTATLKIGPVTRGIAKWLGTDWVPGSTRRIVVADTVAGDSTQLYSYALTVTNQWNGASVLTSPAATVQVPVVSRKQSAFGAGWWLAGVERLYTDSMLWVGGDGSTRRYTAAGTNVWGAPNVDRPDTLKKNPTLNQYTRYLQHGVRVVFDAQGRHIFTIGRLSDTTRFTWSAGDTLQSITLPPAGLTYQFTYTNGSRWVVTAPSNANQIRADTGMVSTGRLTTIRGPDSTRVSFGYATGPDVNHIVSRTDRRGWITTYGYDGGKRVVQSLRPDIGTTRWQSLETVGYPLGDAPQATDTALAHARYEGPRTDVWDTTAFWLDRLGSPRQIANALGYQTLLTRGDARWPALATQVQGPTGLVTQATYDAHGNVLTATQIDPLGDGRNAVTTYTWDMVWDFATSTTLPQGEISQTAYDPATGNRLWQHPGTDPARNVQFFYTNDAFHQLRAIQYPTSPVTSDSVFYDATLRNVSSTKTPAGLSTTHLTDAIGRDTITRWLDVTNLSARVAYDVTGQDTLNVNFPDDGSGTLTVRKHYDPEGNQDSVQTQSSPDPAAIGWMRHVFTYDAANRKTSEHQVGPTATFYFAYDPAGNLINGGRQGGYNVAVTYDALNRPIRRAQLAGDVATFTYDTLGNVLTADNSEAWIRRAYYRNGALKGDTLKLATDFLPAHDSATHVYRQEFRYDMNVRRVWAKHPAQLAPGTDTVAYTYDPVFGQLASLTDPLGNRYAFTFDSLGRPRRITRYPVGQDSVYETVAYDGNGRLSSRHVQTGATAVLDEVMSYFGDGAKMQSATHTYINDAAYTDQFQYTGLGGLTSADMLSGPETYQVDALGNRTYADHSQGIQPDNYHYEPASGFLLFREEIRPPGSRGTGKDTTFYQNAGDGRLVTTEHRHYWLGTLGGGSGGGVGRNSTVSLYDPELRLTQTTFFADSADAVGAPPYAHYVSTENYRYDALGRRVYRRGVRGFDCLHHDAGSGCKSQLTRTVWDGSQILYEIQVPGDTGSSQLESDSPSADSTHGVVGYLHAGGIDQPLALWKNNEAVMFPFASYRGAFVRGTCPSTTCNLSYFPAGLWSSFGDPPTFHFGPPFWHGSLIDGGMDASGFQYRRNRYYDPNSGRFTQEDPLGLAGGLNLYGFAGGDPVNFSDPFGLCPPQDDNWGPDCERPVLSYVLGAIDQALGTNLDHGLYGSTFGKASYLAANNIGPAFLVMEGAGAAAAPEAEAEGSIPASGARVNAAEQRQVNALGEQNGCHTCGATSPGTKSGNWVGDHQPPTALAKPGQAQRLYPQCLKCSRIQGGQVRQATRRPQDEVPQPQ